MSGTFLRTSDELQTASETVRFAAKQIQKASEMLEYAERLAREVLSLNPAHLEIGPGKLANMQQYAKWIMEK